MHFCRSGSCCFEVESLYDTSIALVTFSFGSVFGMVMVRGMNRQDIFEDEEDYLQMVSILRAC